MYSCKDVALRADAMLDAELGLMERLQMRLHLLMCKGCAAFVEQLRVTRDLSKAALDAARGTPEDWEKLDAILQMARDPLQATQGEETVQNFVPWRISLRHWEAVFEHDCELAFDCVPFAH